MRKIFGINHTSLKGGKVMGNTFLGRSLRCITFIGLVTMSLVVWGVQKAKATTITLTDQNSTVTIDPHTQTGMNNWTVDGVDHLYKQWFWYRIGSATPESSINTLTLGSHAPFGSMVWVNYDHAQFKLAVGYVLTGGTSGSNTSDVAEIISIQNKSTTSSLDFHFFQYTDFDLNNTPNDDFAQLTNPSKWEQWDGSGLVVNETVTTGTPRYQVASGSTLLNSLNDGSATTLSNFGGPLGPDNVSFAFQWDLTIGPSGTFLISKDKHLGPAPVPEPATIALLGTGLLGMLGYSRRRFGKKG